MYLLVISLPVVEAAADVDFIATTIPLKHNGNRLTINWREEGGIGEENVREGEGER